MYVKMSVPRSHFYESVIHSSSESEESTYFSAESTPSPEEVKPISSFINNRRKMLDIAFSAVNADKLKSIVPAFLKDATLDELKLICYEELCSLTDEALKSILEGNSCDELSSSDEKTVKSSVQISSHEPRTMCGFEACKSEDTSTSIDSKNKDVLEIGISEEEVNHLLKEIPNTQDTPKDTMVVTTPSQSVASTSGKKHYLSDDVSTIHRDSLHIVEVEPDALDEDLFEILELEHRARSIRSLIMQCDSERENVPEISHKSTETDLSEHKHTNSKCNDLDGVIVNQKHQELDPLLVVCTPASKVLLTSCEKNGTNLNCKSKLTLYETLGRSAVLVSGDYTVVGSEIPKSITTGVIHGNVKGNVNGTVECDNYHTNTLESPCNHNSAAVESIFHNTGQLQITISALNGGSFTKRDLQTSSDSAEKLREKHIHKVVETSKMCTKLRERIKRTQQLKKFKEDNIKAKTVILGTVEEYKSLNAK